MKDGKLNKKGDVSSMIKGGLKKKRPKLTQELEFSQSNSSFWDLHE